MPVLKPEEPPPTSRNRCRCDERTKIEALRSFARMLLFDTEDVDACDGAKVFRDVQLMWRIVQAEESA